MNERIQQLADRALQLVADEHTDGDESRLNTDSYHVKDLIQAKFAELIVRECNKIMAKQYQGPIPQDVRHMMLVLQEHFEIEQDGEL